MSRRMRILLLGVFGAVAITVLCQVVPHAVQAELARRVVHTDPAGYRPLQAAHYGAGTMTFTALLNRGAVAPDSNFPHRGEMPAGAGIGEGKNL
jgi:hypothetical protein